MGQRERLLVLLSLGLREAAVPPSFDDDEFPVTPLSDAILAIARKRGTTRTFCPSEVARAVWPDDWRDHMDEVRTEAARLIDTGLLDATQKGNVVPIAAAVGPIRLRATPGAVGRIPFAGRLGLCCQFAEQPIAFRTTTATSLLRLPRTDRLRKLSTLCLTNARALRASLEFCEANGIGAFRIASTLLPSKTHPEAGYDIGDLPESAEIVRTFRDCGAFARQKDIRTTFHPDQFVVLNSPRPEVVERSIEDLVYHAEVAEWVGADAINIHGGGAFGDKPAALATLVRNVERLSDAVRSRLTFENDDKVYTPSDLLPVCRATGVPLVYDVHHHRCLGDGLTVEAATEAALTTWNREPLFHISSPLEGWSGPRPERHHDEIDPADFPECWRPLQVTVDVEAKAKELAVLRLRKALG